jgi:hypothetical protein
MKNVLRMKHKVIFYVDYSISFFKEIYESIKSRSHIVESTDNLLDAKLIIVLQKPSQIKQTINEIRKISIYCPILTTPNPLLVDTTVLVYFFNDRLIDLYNNIFMNELYELRSDIVHIDCQFQYRGINLRTEMVCILALINEIKGGNPPNLKYSFNGKNCLHLTGYNDNKTFTMSCFISNCSKYGGFRETITVYTKHNGVFTLGPRGGIGRHLYSERYGACWDKIVDILCDRGGKFEELKQKQIIDMLKVDRSFGGLGIGPGRQPPKRKRGFGGVGPKFGRRG